jgi:hypothetical protein
MSKKSISFTGITDSDYDGTLITISARDYKRITGALPGDSKEESVYISNILQWTKLLGKKCRFTITEVK